MRSSLPFLISLTALIAACQPIPRPFSHPTGQPPELLALPDAPGVTVLPIARAPEPTATALSRAMAAALRDDNIPAATFGGNRATLFLQGSVEDNGEVASLVWELFDGSGTLLGRHIQSIDGTPVDLWQVADPDLLASLADTASPHLAAFIRPQTDRTDSASPTVAIALPAIAGGQTLATEALHSAMRQALSREASVVVADDAAATDNAHTLRGVVSLSARQGPRQDVAITWSLYDADQRQLGAIVQSKNLPAADIAGDWSALAPEIAAAAVPGILDLIDQLDLR